MTKHEHTTTVGPFTVGYTHKEITRDHRGWEHHSLSFTITGKDSRRSHSGPFMMGMGLDPDNVETTASDIVASIGFDSRIIEVDVLEGAEGTPDPIDVIDVLLAEGMIDEETPDKKAIARSLIRSHEWRMKLTDDEREALDNHTDNI